MDEEIEGGSGAELVTGGEGGADLQQQQPADGGQPKTPAPSAGRANVLSDEQVSDLMNRKGWDKITDADARSRAILESFHNLETKMGSARLTAPKPGEVDKWDGWKDLGLPEEPKYEIQRPPAEEGVPYNEELETFMMPKLHAAKLLPFQVQAITDALHEYTKGVMAGGAEAAAADQAEMDKALAKEWGAEKDVKIAMAQKAARFMEIGAEDAAELNRVLGSARLVKHFARLGEMLGEDRLKGGAQPGNTFGMTPEGAKAERQRLLADKGFSDAYYDKSNPGHKAAVAKIEALAKIRAKAGTA